MALFARLPLRHKILAGILAMVAFVAIGIHVVAVDYILMPRLEDELVRRGFTMARAVSVQAGDLVITHDRPKLLALLFEKRRLEESLSYLIVTDSAGRLLADTFVEGMPPGMVAAHPLPAGKLWDMKLVHIGGKTYYDTAYAVMEGIYPVGTARVGLSKALVDDMSLRMHVAVWSVMGVLAVIVIWAGRRFSRQITRPLAGLTAAADQIAAGNLDIELSESAQAAPPGSTQVPLGLVPGAEPRDELEQLTATFAHMVRQLKHSRDELRHAYDFRDNLIRSSPNAVVASDEEGRIVLFNEGAERLFGRSAGEVLGHVRIQDLVPPVAVHAMEAALAGEGRVSDVETRVLHRSGRHVQVAISASVIKEEGRVVGTVGFLRDLTESKRMEEEMKRADRLATVGKAVAYITHEIKNPLMVIGGLAKQVAAQPAPGEREREKLDIIVSEIKRLETILLEVGEFTKTAHLELQPVALPAVLADVLALMQATFEKKQIRLSAELPGGLPAALGEPLKLKQVFINLIKNATDAMPQGGQLWVSARAHEGRLQARIKDSGPGIPPEVMRELFTPFFTTKPKGTGLGLVISRQIVQEHHGSLRVESEPGQGAECIIELPVAAAEAGAPQAA